MNVWPPLHCEVAVIRRIPRTHWSITQQRLRPRSLTSLLCRVLSDSHPDCRADSQGGPPGLSQTVAGAHPHPPGVGEGPGRPAAAPRAPHLLPRHQDPGLQTAGPGQAPLPGRKPIWLSVSGLSGSRVCCVIRSVGCALYAKTPCESTHAVLTQAAGRCCLAALLVCFCVQTVVESACVCVLCVFIFVFQPACGCVSGNVCV